MGWIIFIGEKILLLVFIFLVIIIILLVVENTLHKRNLNNIKIRILVNGTRGKTSTTRIIASAMQSHGIRTIARTTGSAAEVIYPDGIVKPIERKKKARITELIDFVHIAKKENVDCIVVECMALKGENQRIVAQKLIRPTHVVITNCYVDHIVEIGSTEEETVATLAKSIHPDSEVFALDCRIGQYSSHFHKVEKEHFDLNMNIPIHDDNIALAKAVLSSFDIGDDEIISSLGNVSPDIGLHKEIRFSSGSKFLPYFSINDSTSMIQALHKFESEHLFLIYNNRKDREYRLKPFIDSVGTSGVKVEKIYVIGDYPRKVCRYFEKYLYSSTEAISVADLALRMRDSKDCTFLALGNIKGDGECLVSMLLEKSNE